MYVYMYVLLIVVTRMHEDMLSYRGVCDTLGNSIFQVFSGELVSSRN